MWMNEKPTALQVLTLLSGSSPSSSLTRESDLKQKSVFVFNIKFYKVSGVWWHTSVGQGWHWESQSNYKFYFIQDVALYNYSTVPSCCARPLPASGWEEGWARKRAQNRVEGRHYNTALTLPLHYVPLSNCISIQCCEQSKQYLITQLFDIEDDVSILSPTFCTVQTSMLFCCVI